MVRAKRTKRASVTDIYRGCKAAGTCPPDVLNKVEHTTIADKILQYGSAGVFFGGLGISTGRGTGGATGYVPLGEGPGVRVGGTPTIVRPGVIPEIIGPTDLIPLDTVRPIDPTAPSIVTGTDSTVDLLPGEIESIAEIHPVPVDNAVVDTPVVTEGRRGSSAILEVADPSPPMRTRVARTQYHNPAFQIISESTPMSGESSLADHIIVFEGSGGQLVGGPRESYTASSENIELQEFPSRYSFEIDEGTPPRTSTPVQRAVQSLSSLRRALYNRRLTEQVAVTDPLFLSRPSRLVQFQFDNPAFEDEVTQIFERDLSTVEEPPDRQFLDVQRLSRPLYTETPQGYVRVSRLGRRATIRTRSGAQVGAQVHFYRDLSTINTEEPIEMQLLGEHSGDSTIIQGPVESSIVDVNIDEPDGLEVGRQETPSVEDVDFNSEDLLLDEGVEDFSGSQLVVGTRRSTNTLTVPRFETPRDTSFYIQDIQGYTVSYPESRQTTDIIFPHPDTPTVVIHINDTSGDYYLHPSLQRKKRKRKYL